MLRAKEVKRKSKTRKGCTSLKINEGLGELNLLKRGVFFFLFEQQKVNLMWASNSIETNVFNVKFALGREHDFKFKTEIRLDL